MPVSKKYMDMQNLGDKLFDLVTAAKRKLDELSGEGLLTKSAPDRWSRQEILGHLIDSAANNHQRFVRAHWQDNLTFPGYRQDDWVKVSHYQQAYWSDLVELWSRYNLHLATIIRHIPRDILDQKHRKHNLDQIAWKVVPQSEETTLRYFIEDYIDHMQHHLNQILEA